MRWLTIALSLFLATGCASSATVLQAQSQPQLGTTKTFAKPCGAHGPAVKEMAVRFQWMIDEEDAPRQTLIASTPVGAWTWGEHIAVQLHDDGERCRIQVYSRRAYALNITATNWEDEFFASYPPSR